MGATTFTYNPITKKTFTHALVLKDHRKPQKYPQRFKHHPPTHPHTDTHTHTHTHTHTLALKASNIKKLKEDILTEEVIQRRSVKKMFLENSQNLLENTCAFLNKVAAGTSASL